MRLAAVVALAAVASVPVRAEEPAAKPAFDRVKPHLQEYFNADEKARADLLLAFREAGLDSIEMTRAQADAVEKIVLAGNPKVKIRGGEYTIDVETKEGRLATHFHAPPGLSSKPVPLFVALHGGGPSDYESGKTHAKEMMGWLFKWTDAMGALLVVPSTPTGWGSEQGQEAIWKSIGYAQENYNIDPNRVVVYGGSMGGYGVCSTITARTDFFAAACPFIGCSDLTGYAENFSNVCFYIVVGEKDPYVDNKAAKLTSDRLKELGYDVTFREMKDKGHEVPPSEYPPLVAKLKKTSRNMYAPKLHRGNGSGRWYWLECGGDSDGEYAGQTVTVKGNVSAVYLSDRMMDLDKPVKIVQDGEVKFEGMVKRSLALMLKEVDDTRDRGRVFSAKVDIR